MVPVIQDDVTSVADGTSASDADDVTPSSDEDDVTRLDDPPSVTPESDEGDVTPVLLFVSRPYPSGSAWASSSFDVPWSVL